MKIVPLLLFSAIALFAAPGANAALKPVGLRTEYLQNPDGVEAAQPRLQWRVEAEGRGHRQTAYRILVASSEAVLGRDEGDLWDSKQTEGDETTQIPYSGSALPSGQPCFWKVQTWDQNGEVSPWSEIAKWSMGLLKPADWKADWISFKDTSPLHTSREKLHLPPAQHYRKGFEAPREVKRAMLYFSVLGIAEMELNGRRIGDAYFESGWSDYRKRAYYRTHDVTSLVRAGQNRISATVADGWYAGYVGYGLLVGRGPGKTGRNIYGKTPALLAQLEIEYSDGSREIVGTDPTWETSGDGPFREADFLMGESYDARRTDESQWKWAPAIRAGENGSTKAKFFEPGNDHEVELGFQKPPKLAAYTVQPIRVVEELPAKRSTEPKPGTYIFDLGENIAGVIRLRVKGPAGSIVQIRYGEMLHKDGLLMTENLRKARATDFYTLRGDAQGETWQPRFTYHGFQFVELTGLTEKPSPDAVTGLVLSNDMPSAGSFSCSDPVMTQFWKNTVRTQVANFIELPTDCPQRDERLGWMGDAQTYVRTASYNADVSAFFTKWLDDVEESQRASGAYPDYAPYPFAHGKPGATHGTAWTDAGIICPWTIWQVYGDTRVLTRHWDSMTKFMAWRAKADPESKGVNNGNPWGDWLNVNESTPIEYIDVCYHFISARMMSEMAALLGKDEESGKYTARMNALARSFKAQFTKANHTLTVETQTAAVLAISSGILAHIETTAGESWVTPIAQGLVERISKNGNRMATGFLGTKPLLPVLTETGHNDLAVRLFQSRTFPSWGYEVEQGATSVWERWDSYTKEHGFDGATGKNNAAMNSFSHYAFGAVMQWAFQTLAGIDTDGAGFRRIVINPHPPTAQSGGGPKPVEWVKAHYDSIHGRIVSEWKRDGNRFALRTVIPANTSAVIHLPRTEGETVTEGGKPLEESAGVKIIEGGANRMTLEVGSGAYDFAVSPKNP